jgi:microcystin-dependent protein
MRGRVPVGVDNLGGTSAAGRVTFAGSGIYGTSPAASGGSQSVTLTTAQMPVHNHNINDPGYVHTVLTRTDVDISGVAGAYAATGISGNSTNSATTGITVQNAGGGEAHNNMPPTLMTNYIIKYC